jgi:hypothetical protein
LSILSLIVQKYWSYTLYILIVKVKEI